MTNEKSRFDQFVMGMVRDLRMRFIDAIIPTTAEYGVKVLMMDSLLKSGCVLREAGNGQDKLFGVSDGDLRRQLVSKMSPRGRVGEEKKQIADVRIEWPIPCDVCLKAASQHGSQEYLYSGRGSFKHGVCPDLDNVRHGRADVFILAADQKCYDTLRGDRALSGRKAEGIDEVIRLLPAAIELASECLVDDCVGTRDEFRFYGTRVTGLTGVRRVLLAMWAKDGPRRTTAFEGWGKSTDEILN